MQCRMDKRTFVFTKDDLLASSKTFFKVQDWITHIDCVPKTDETTAATIISCGGKAMRLLRKVLHLERFYFRNILVWVVDQLLALKEVDFSLLGLLYSLQPVINRMNYSNYFSSHLILLKYFLPEKYFPQVDVVLLATEREIDRLSSHDPLKAELSSLMSHVFSGEFSPKEDSSSSSSSSTASFVPYIYFVPVLSAFQHQRMGLLLEWENWITLEGLSPRHKPAQNPFRVQLLNEFQTVTFLLFPSTATITTTKVILIKWTSPWLPIYSSNITGNPEASEETSLPHR
jgi:hypothetical protein